MENNNGAEKLISVILEDAHEQASAIEWRSAEAITEIKSKLEQAREDVRDEFTQRATSAREQIIATARTNAELTARKDLLAGRRALIDEAYSEAYKAVCALTGEKRDALLLKLLRRECEGGETVRPSEKDRAAIEKLLPQAGEGLALGQVDETLSDGFTLIGSNYYKNCSFTALMDEVRALSEADVTGLLFGK